jgi:hypothetical protein
MSGKVTGSGATALPPPAPLPEGFSLSGLLDDIEAYLRSFVLLPSDDAAAVLALYIAHTAVIEAFDCTPYLFVRSPEPRCGKTVLLRCMQAAIPYALSGVSWTEATLFRSIIQKGKRHVLILDEIDQLLGRTSDGSDPRVSVINAGNERGARVPRAVERKGDYEVEFYDAFCPKVLGGIDVGNLLPSTLDRCIIVNMVRADEGDRDALSRARARIVEEKARPIREALRSWGAVAEEEIAALNPAEVVEDIAGLSDRAMDGAEPLLMVAHMAGTEWHVRARQAVSALCSEGDTTGTLTLAQQALLDLFRVFVIEERGLEEFLPASYLCDQMERLDGSPWLRVGLDAQSLSFQMRRYMADWGTVSKRFTGRFRVASTSTVAAYPMERLVPLWEKYLSARTKTEFQVDEHLARIRGGVGGGTPVSTDAEPRQSSDAQSGFPKGSVGPVGPVGAPQEGPERDVFNHLNPLTGDLASRVLIEHGNGLDLSQVEVVEQALGTNVGSRPALRVAIEAVVEHLDKGADRGGK